MQNDKIIYTIGHSNHSFSKFLEMLQSYNVRSLVDIRRLPGSRKYPQYDQETLKDALNANCINYYYFESLGGRRYPEKNSHNNRWRNKSFQGYADHMETVQFKEAVEKLEMVAMSEITVYMCAEAVWWRCHRAMISDYLKARNWSVYHILAVNNIQEHPFTSPAEVINKKVYYGDH